MPVAEIKALVIHVAAASLVHGNPLNYYALVDFWFGLAWLDLKTSLN